MIPTGAEAGASPAIRSCIDQAARIAADRGASAIDPGDLLIAVVQSGGEAATALRELGAEPATVIESAWHRLPHLRSGSPPPGTSAPPPGAGAAAVLDDAAAEARLLSHQAPARIHLLLALAYRTAGSAFDTLSEAGITLVDLRLFAQRSARSGEQPGPPAAGASVPRPRPQRRVAHPFRPSPVLLVPLGAAVLGAIGLWSGNAAVRWPAMLGFVLGGWIVTICVHEFCHAITAYWGGDRSVVDSGYLTMNPLRYANPLLSIVLPLVFILLGGIGFPGGAIYFDPRALRNRGWQSLVSAAGPVGTLLCLAVIVLPFLTGWWTQVAAPANVMFWAGLALLGFLQITIFVFNLLPIPPLDGWGVIAPYLPAHVRYQAARLGAFILLGIFMLLLIGPLNQVFYSVLLNLSGIAHLPYTLIYQGLTTLRPYTF